MVTSSHIDRIVGILVTAVGGGILTYCTLALLRDLLKRSGTSQIEDDADKVEDLVLHKGSCHCERVRFRVKAPKKIKALSVQSKIKFTRIIVPCEYFEALTDESLFSLYPVKFRDAIGIHTFCSFCGVQVLFSKSIEPVEIEINVDCLDPALIEKIDIIKDEVRESYACPTSMEAAQPFNRRGCGYSQSTPFFTSLSTLMHFQPGSHAYVYTGIAEDRAVADAVTGYTPSSIFSHTGGESLIDHTPTASPQRSYVPAPDFDDASMSQRKVFIDVSSPTPSDVALSQNSSSESSLPLSPISTRKFGAPIGNEVSIDTPMHRQLRRHLQHYLRPQTTAAVIDKED